MSAWQWALSTGWELHPRAGHNCVYGVFEGERVRLNFRDQEVLKLERKVRLTPEERAAEPLTSARWVPMETAKYEDTRIVKGQLHFHKKGEGETVKEKSDG
jgi:hypothetical protein